MREYLYFRVGSDGNAAPFKSIKFHGREPRRNVSFLLFARKNAARCVSDGK